LSNDLRVEFASLGKLTRLKELTRRILNFILISDQCYHAQRNIHMRFVVDDPKRTYSRRIGARKVKMKKGELENVG
jgi:hypothetical protein